jgi:hypothetical protein
MNKIKINSRGLFIILCYFTNFAFGQTNLVGNPSFEEHCTQGWVNYWPGLDTLVCNPGTLASSCPNNGLAPKNSLTFQYAKSGQGYMICGFFLPNIGLRGFLKNRLLTNLVKDETYCVRFYVNLTNKSSRGMDGFQAYFGSKLLDTISVCPTSSMNLVPQISNPNGNIITDTLNWVPVQGTLTATGDEVYMVIGNFKSDAATNTVLINPTYTIAFTDVCVDDVSCVPIDLPADAGPNKPFFGGDSVFIGRTPNVGIDYACTWFQLPNMTAPIATVAGLWVKPVVTTTYVVRQQLWCAGIKYDTVVVYKDAVGIRDLDVYLENVKLFPNPASSNLSIQFTQPSVSGSIERISVYNQLGQRVPSSVISKVEENFQVDCSTLNVGLYFLRFELESGGSFVKNFVVER